MSPRSRGVGTPRVCRAADYLPSRDCGSVASCHRAMVDRAEGAATQRPTRRRRGLTQNSRAGNPKRTRPNYHLSPKRGALEPAWIASIIGGGDPKTLLREREGTQGPWRRGVICCCSFVAATATTIRVDGRTRWPLLSSSSHS